MYSALFNNERANNFKTKTQKEKLNYSSFKADKGGSSSIGSSQLVDQQDEKSALDFNNSSSNEGGAASIESGSKANPASSKDLKTAAGLMGMGRGGLSGGIGFKKSSNPINHLMQSETPSMPTKDGTSRKNL